MTPTSEKLDATCKSCGLTARAADAHRYTCCDYARDGWTQEGLDKMNEIIATLPESQATSVRDAWRELKAALWGAFMQRFGP
jgi:hypothetical protein